MMKSNELRHSASTVVEAEVSRIQAELLRRFAGAGGAMARADSFAALFPAAPFNHVEEALYRLWQEGIAESHCLGDGMLAYYFPSH